MNYIFLFIIVIILVIKLVTIVINNFLSLKLVVNETFYCSGS